MRSVLPFDEINRLIATLRERYPDGKLTMEGLEDILDMMLDLFLLSYAMGNTVTNESLSSSWIPSSEEVMAVINKEIAGKNWEERVREYVEQGGTVDDLIRIVETESHRDANTGALDTATHGGATKKTWATMLDDRVRDSHIPLEGITVPIDGYFYTWDGDKAQMPGGFDLPENNCNCRCELIYS